MTNKVHFEASDGRAYCLESACKLRTSKTIKDVSCKRCIKKLAETGTKVDYAAQAAWLY